MRASARSAVEWTMSYGKRTLVVSPDPGLVQQVRSVLSDDAIPVTSAPTLAAALAELDRRTHALVIAALALPDGSGYELCADVKRMQPGVVVLLAGEDRDGRAIDRSHSAGADGFIHRPFAAAELLGRLQDLMDATFFDGVPERVVPESTGPSALSLVDPMTGVFLDENTGYSVSVMEEDDDDASQRRGPLTEELPPLAFELFDPDHPVSIPVSAHVTAHGLAPLDSHSDLPAVRPGQRPSTSLRPPPMTSETPGPSQAIDARIEVLLAPGGRLNAAIESAVSDAVGKALRDALPGLIEALAKSGR